MYEWKVCPIQGRQLKDVRKEDIFGDFRICDTYRGGGGYDQFPKIVKSRLNYLHCPLFDTASLNRQFVVQLYGCHLDCPYCYVTSDGVRGKYVKYETTQLVNWFHKSYWEKGCRVFHLMGGSPALYMEHWPELINKLFRHNFDDYVFTSDLLLTEKEYDVDVLREICHPNALYAVNIKGVTSEDYKRNTNKELDCDLFSNNLDKLYDVGVNFYITFTNPDMSYFDTFKKEIRNRYLGRREADDIEKDILQDSFVIDLKWDYEALKA